MSSNVLGSPIIVLASLGNGVKQKKWNIAAWVVSFPNSRPHLGRGEGGGVRLTQQRFIQEGSAPSSFEIYHFHKVSVGPKYFSQRYSQSPAMTLSCRGSYRTRPYGNPYSHSLPRSFTACSLFQGHPATFYCKITVLRSKYCLEISQGRPTRI